MEKTLKVEIPKGYEINKEKSTFETIVFKKIDDVVIKWNKNYNGVEIKADGEHFIVDASRPSYYCSWDDAMRFYECSTWSLPTVKQLQVLSKHIDKVNEIIRENNGYEIQGCFWSCEKVNEFRVWDVCIDDEYTNTNIKDFNFYVRAVSAL